MANKPGELIDGYGNFNRSIEGHLQLARENGLIGTVSVIGVQSTGKSTLLNKCFSTDFKEMDASQGINQTTKGVWIAKCSLPGPNKTILVIDTEGTDGSERAEEGNYTFEKRTTFFALAMSNVVIFNMKCDNVNLNQGACMPLLEIVFQVMIRKFSNPRLVHLVFVLRDKSEVPLDKLREKLMEKLYKMWDKMPRPQTTGHSLLRQHAAALEDYLNIEVVALPHFRFQKEEFNAEVGNLKSRIFSLVQFCQLTPASAFITLARMNWSHIQDDKILNTDINMMESAAMICDEIKEEMIKKFEKDERWVQIQRDAESGRISIENVHSEVMLLTNRYINQYDGETQYLDERLRDLRRNQLAEQLSQTVFTYMKDRVFKPSQPNRNVQLNTDAQRTYVKTMRDAALANVLTIVDEVNDEAEGQELLEIILKYKKFLEGIRIEDVNLNDPLQVEQLKNQFAQSSQMVCLYIEMNRAKAKASNRKQNWMQKLLGIVKKFGSALVNVGLSYIPGVAGLLPLGESPLRITYGDGNAGAGHLPSGGSPLRLTYGDRNA